MIRKFKTWFGAGAADPAGAAVLPEGPIDLLSPEVVADPYPLYAALRRDRPLAELVQGGYLLTRHADVMAAFTNPDLGNAPSRFSVLSARNRGKYVAADIAANIPPFHDMPEHQLSRRALTFAVFETLKAQRAGIVEAARLRVDAAASGPLDLIADIASPFAAETAARVVGLEDAGEVKALSAAFFHLFAPVTDPLVFRATNAELVRAREVLAEALLARRAAPGEDVLSHLLTMQREKPELSDTQILDCALLILADSVENIEAGAASLLPLCLAAPEACASDDLGAVIAEGLRLETPAQSIPRIAKRDTTLKGTPIKAGTPVHLSLASANRDGDVFAEPDSFLPGRETEALTFGRGRHRCLGEQLALGMLGPLLAALLDRGATLAEPPGTARAYHPRMGHRWPVSLAMSLR